MIPQEVSSDFSPGIVPDAVRQALAALDQHPPHLLSGRPPGTILPLVDVAALLAALGHALGESVHPVVHVVSAYEGEGSGPIAFEAALAAARSGKRVLYVETAPPARSVIGRAYATPGGPAPLPLDSFLGSSTAPASSPFWLIEGAPLWCTVLSAGGASLPGSSVQHALFSRLRQMFDLVVVHSESGLSNGTVAAYAALVDGSVMVIEAERTREPVAQELKHRIESNGGRVLGAVLNNRRFYIPGFVYSLLYGKKR